jgi:hypothetical protein
MVGAEGTSGNVTPQARPRRWFVAFQILIEHDDVADLDNRQRKLAGASSITAFATLRVKDPLRRLPTETATLIIDMIVPIGFLSEPTKNGVDPPSFR